MKKAFLGLAALIAQTVISSSAMAQTPAPISTLNLAPGAVQTVGNVQVNCQRPSNSINVSLLTAEQLVNLGSGGSIGICRAGYSGPGKVYVLINDKYYQSQGSVEMSVEYAGEALRTLIQAGACY